MAKKKDNKGAGRGVTTAGAAGEPRDFREPLSDVSAELSRVMVSTSRFGATKGQELLRTIAVDVSGRDSDGRAQGFTAATAQSLDRGQTWRLRDHVLRRDLTVTGGQRAVRKVLTDIGRRPHTDWDAEKARAEQYGGGR